MTPGQTTVLLYAAAVFVTVLLAIQSHRDATAKLSLVLAGSWMGTLVANRVFGPLDAPYVHVAADTVMGLLVLGLGARYRSWCAAAVLLVYVIMDSWHLGAFFYGTESARTYKLGLNVLFAIQLLIVGSVGAAQWCARSVGRLGGSSMEPVSHRRAVYKDGS